MAKEKEKPPVLDVASSMREATIRNIEFESQISNERTENEEAIQRIRDTETKRLSKRRGDVQQTIKLPEARRTIWRLLECGWPADRTTFVPGDPHMSSLNEGRRIVSLEMMKIILDADPNVLLQMQREHSSDLKAEYERRRKEQQEREGA